MKPGAVKLVRNIVSSGFDEGIARGDQFAIWVYNEQNSWNRFPLQTWDPEKAELTGEVGAQFIASEIFQKESRFEPVSRDLSRLLVAHPNLVLLLVTNGESPVSGISYDIEINTEVSEYKKAHREINHPFLVSLLALNGKVQSWRIFNGTGKMDLPKFPGAPKLAGLANSQVDPRSESERREPAKTRDAEEKGSSKTEFRSKKEEKASPPIVIDLPPGAKIIQPEIPPAVVPMLAESMPVAEVFKAIPAAEEKTAMPGAEVTSTKPAIIERAAKPVNSIGEKSTANVLAETKLASKDSRRGPGSSAPEHEQMASAPRVSTPVSSISAQSAELHVEPAGSAQSGWINPVYFFAAAALALLVLGVGLFLMQRRAQIRGSIISQSYSIRP
jgi:hypothetical protein